MSQPQSTSRLEAHRFYLLTNFTALSSLFHQVLSEDLYKSQILVLFQITIQSVLKTSGYSNQISNQTIPEALKIAYTKRGRTLFSIVLGANRKRTVLLIENDLSHCSSSRK